MTPHYSSPHWPVTTCVVMETTRHKAYLDAEKIEPKHRTPGCSLDAFVCMCTRSIWCPLHMGRLWAEMRGEFLSRCVMFIHPHSDGGFPNNEDEVEGQKVMPGPYKKCIFMAEVLTRETRDLER